MFVQNYRKIIKIQFFSDQFEIKHLTHLSWILQSVLLQIKAKQNHQNKNTGSLISRILPSKFAFLFWLCVCLFCLGRLLVSLKHPLEEPNPVHNESWAQLLWSWSFFEQDKFFDLSTRFTVATSWKVVASPFEPRGVHMSVCVLICVFMTHWPSYSVKEALLLLLSY